jgi:hypothetical protein
LIHCFAFIDLQAFCINILGMPCNRRYRDTTSDRLTGSARSGGVDTLLLYFKQMIERIPLGRRLSGQIR